MVRETDGFFFGQTNGIDIYDFFSFDHPVFIIHGLEQLLRE
jgi:hypothetical protein